MARRWRRISRDNKLLLLYTYIINLIYDTVTMVIMWFWTAPRLRPLNACRRLKTRKKITLTQPTATKTILLRTTMTRKKHNCCYYFINFVYTLCETIFFFFFSSGPCSKTLFKTTLRFYCCFFSPIKRSAKNATRTVRARLHRFIGIIYKIGVQKVKYILFTGNNNSMPI